MPFGDVIRMLRACDDGARLHELNVQWVRRTTIDGSTDQPV